MAVVVLQTRRWPDMRDGRWKRRGGDDWRCILRKNQRIDWIWSLGERKLKKAPRFPAWVGVFTQCVFPEHLVHARHWGLQRWARQQRCVLSWSELTSLQRKADRLIAENSLSLQSLKIWFLEYRTFISYNCDVICFGNDCNLFSSNMNLVSSKMTLSPAGTGRLSGTSLVMSYYKWLPGLGPPLWLWLQRHHQMSFAFILNCWNHM